MKKKITILAVVLLLGAMCVCPVAAAMLNTVETQFTYNTSNPAWLKDLIIREDMTNIQGTMAEATLIAKPDYPYSKTPESFRTEVNYYCQLYSLDENSQKAAYLYVLQYINQFASEATKNVSDEFIMEYLTSAGIVYPEGGLGDYENLIFARALYTLMSTGAVKVQVTPGTTVQSALLQSMTTVFNIDPSVLSIWSNTPVITIDQYVIIACKIALNTNGFIVDRNTPDEEVYRLTAIMMIRQLGISVNAQTASFDEIKLKYLAALLGLQYDISLDPNDLQNALNRNDVPFYILQVMGRSANITIRSSMSYSEAFTAVAANTDYFALESGEFYADIFKYEVHLQYKRGRIWIAPTAYRTSSATETVMIKINGSSTSSGEYFECALNEALSSQDVAISVTYQSPSQTVTKTYTVTVYQGSSSAPDSGSSILGAGSGNSLIGIAAGNVVNSLANSFYNVSTDLPPRVTNLIPLMTPQINGGVGSESSTDRQNPDYLSQLMYSASGGVSALPNTAGNAGSGTSGNANSLPANTARPGMGALPFRGLSVYSADKEDAPMLLSQAGAPPQGYEYLADSNGYITGIVSAKRHAGAQNIQSSDAVSALLRSKLPVLLIPISIALVGAVVTIAMKAKEKKQRI